MPRKQLKIDVQAEQAASHDDQQLMIYMLGEKCLSDQQSLQNINFQRFSIMINNYMLEMISGDPTSYEKKQYSIPESPSRRKSGSKNTTTFQLSLMSPRTILSPRFDQKADFSDAIQQSIDVRKEQLRPEPKSPQMPKSPPGAAKITFQTKAQFHGMPTSDEQEIIEQVCNTYPNGITVHQAGQHPALQAALSLAKKYNRITFETGEELRIVNDVIFEGVAGVPGFLAWIAVPFILSYYNKTWSIQYIADELLNYGQLITKMFQHSGQQQETDKNFILTPDILRRWYNEQIKGKDQHERLFNVIRKPDSNKIDVLDLQRVAQILLRLHPGLSFLQSTTQFQLLYAQTVALRIVIEADTNFKGYLTVNDLRKYQTQFGIKHCTPFNYYQQGTLLDSLWQSQFEQDINKNLKCFSYEHFYVFYVTFWELDMDKDKLLSARDLEKYQKFSLSQLAIKRAVQLLIRLRAQSPELYYSAFYEKQGVMPKSIEELKRFTGQFKDQLLYPDFIRFLIYLENPDLDASLDFWFEVCDLDGDGYIDLGDFKAFYKQLREKQETIGDEVVEADDMFCQILDYYKGMCRCASEVDGQRDKNSGFFGESAISLQDIRTSQARGNIFSVMIHFQRFQFFEMKDPYTIRSFGLEKTIWERYCKRQYDIQVSGSSQDGAY